MNPPRRARVRAFAKINLALRVLRKRPDDFHEIRTIYQTVSLADTIDICFTPARVTRIEPRGAEIPGNLMVKAAQLALDAMRRTGRVEFVLRKRIPMGAGLGGGSSDAAAVLLALPVLAGGRLGSETLLRLAAELGSDVPFFLLGGCAVGLGRGAEVYPLPDGPALPGVLIAPALHSSTADAYRALSARLTSDSAENKIVSFQSNLSAAANDFEAVVFERFPVLASYKRRLLRAGAAPAMMSGSGSAVFGLFRTREQAARALKSYREERVFPITLVSRRRYCQVWWRGLGAHIERNLWPPQSRYAR